MAFFTQHFRCNVVWGTTHGPETKWKQSYILVVTQCSVVMIMIVAIPVQQWNKPFEAHFNKRVTYAMFILT